jgi:hypothetical protein
LYRALTLDIIKIFLRKFANNDTIIINNITFNDEQFDIIKNNNFNVILLDKIEVIMKTLNYLVETDFKFNSNSNNNNNNENNYNNKIKNKIYWDPIKIKKLNNINEMHDDNSEDN